MAAADRARPRRRDVSDRIADALASRRALGARLGRPRSCADEVLARVVAARARGKRLADIASALNADGVPTPGGGSRWYPSHVSRLLRTQDARQELARHRAEEGE